MNNLYKISTAFDKFEFIFISYGDFKWWVIIWYLLGMLNINYVIHKDNIFPFYESHYLMFTFRKCHPIVALCSIGTNLNNVWLNIPKIHDVGLDIENKITIKEYNKYANIGKE